MSLDFSIDDFKHLYCDKLMSKEEMIRQLNITEYIYKTIIKDFDLIRSKTNKLNRFKANNGIKIEAITKTHLRCSPEAKTENDGEQQKITENDGEQKKMTEATDETNEDLINKVTSILQKSRKNRTIKKY